MVKDPAREALNMLPYGFYAVGSKSGEDVNLMVVNWLTQCAFAPRQVAFGLSKTAHTHGLVVAGGVFSASIFGREDGAERIMAFTKSRAKNPTKVSDADTRPGPQTGCPLVAGAMAWLECRVVQVADSGADHDVVIGEVIGAGVERAGKPADTLTLVDMGWSYAG